MSFRNVAVTSSLLILVLLLAGCSGKPSIYERGGMSTTDLLNNILDQTTTVLSDVFNVESAEAALPQLVGLNEEFDKLIDVAGDLSDEGKQELADKAARAMPGLKANARRINGQKGISDVLGTEMNNLVFELTELL